MLKDFKHNVKLSVLAGLTMSVLGCSNLHVKDDSMFYDVKNIPEFDLLEVHRFDKDNELLKYKISDQTIYKFSFLIMDTLKKKERQGRVGEETFAGIQVTLAALAAAFSTGSVHPDLITGLTAASALTPDMADIINAGEKSKAYGQALEMVENAISEYIKARAQNESDPDEVISDEEITAEGAALFVSVVSTLKVMRDALHAIIPKAEDLEKALGKYNLFQVNVNGIKLTPTEVGILPAAAVAAPAGGQTITKEVLVTKGGNIAKCSSSSPDVATVKDCVGKDRVTITILKQGESTITLVNEKQETLKFEITN